MQKIVFEDTTVVKSPYVIIDGVEHEVYNGTYQGGTDLNAQTFNQMQDNIESAIDTVASDIPTVVDSLDGDSTTNAPSVHAVKNMIKVQNVNVNIGVLNSVGTTGAEKFDQETSYTIEQGYKCLGIVGYSLVGGYYTSCILSRLYADDSKVYWAIRNTGQSQTGDITLNVTLMLIKTTD